jgi:hypothetical protein
VQQVGASFTKGKKEKEKGGGIKAGDSSPANSNAKKR